MTLVDILEYQPKRLQSRLSRVCVHRSGGFVSRHRIAVGGGGFLATDVVNTARVLLTKFWRGLIGQS